MIQQLRQWMDKVLAIMLVVILVALVVTVIWQVFSRYGLQSPSTVTDEVARFLLIWLALLGAAWCVGQRAHLAVDLLADSMTPEKAALLNKGISLLIAVFSLAVLVVGGNSLVDITLKLGQMSTVLRLPVGYVYTVLPISGVLIFVYAMMDVIAPKSAPQTQGE